MLYITRIKNTKPLGDRFTYPYNIPSIANLEEFEFHKNITFFTGENGSGKSTLIEAIAIKAGFNPEGGSLNFDFHTKNSHSQLYNDIKLIRSAYRNKDGFFLRAESFYNVATAIDDYSVANSYGGSLHCCSHGESFLALVQNRLSSQGLYIFDEPESALSIQSQFYLMLKIKELSEKQSQFIIATHSPILMAYPDADIFHISNAGIKYIDYEDTEQYKLTKYFINNYRNILQELGL